MRRTVATLLGAIGMSGVMTPASAAAVLFTGVTVVESASSACGILPYVEQGALFRTVYRPAGAGTNGQSTSLIMVPATANFTDLVITSFTLVNASLDASFREVDVVQITSTKRLSLNFEEFVASMRLLQQTPGDVDGADFLALRLQVRTFGNVANCTVTLRGILSGKATPKL
jgi:hypothetical protein